MKAVTFICTPALRSVPLTQISSQTFPSQPSPCWYQQPKFPKYALAFTPGGEERPHGKTVTIMGNFPNLRFSESLREKSDSDIKAVIKPAYTNPNRSFSFNTRSCFELRPYLTHHFTQYKDFKALLCAKGNQKKKTDNRAECTKFVKF